MNETIHAPDFPYDFEWVNSSRPLSLFDDLQGYVILVHFFTASNVNCHHVFETLGYLEQRFADRSFTVVGVHTGKFTGERDHDHVVQDVRRFGLRHPVVIDEGAEVWKSYSSRAWPFLVLIDATGHVRFQGAGEPDRHRMASAIQALLEEAEADGDEPYAELVYEEADAPVSLKGLRFPTGLACGRDQLWIADSSRHRLVGVDPATGQVQTTIGTGESGASDGAFEMASFCLPQGLLFVGDVLFVADTGNHLIRRVDFDEGRVDSVLGTGRPVVDFEGGGSGPAQPINSPWDMCMHRDQMYVSMGGLHQIWRVEMDTMTASPFAGNDTKGLFDGPVRDASLAQPAGLDVSGDRIAFVDSDSSSLRCLDFTTGEITTRIEGGVYKWGKRAGEDPKLQNPRAVVWHGEDLLVADTMNDRVLRVRDGRGDPLELDVHRPEGLCLDGDTLFVADTGNHRVICVVFAADGSTTHEVLPMEGLPVGRSAFGTDFVLCAPIQLPPLGEATLRLPTDLPEDAMFQPETRPRLEAENFEGHPLLVDVTVHPDVDGDQFHARGIATGEEGEGVLHLRLIYSSCRDPGKNCHVHERRLAVPVTIAADADPTADLTPAE